MNPQITEIELVRSAFKLEKKDEVASFMQLSEPDAKQFWPIYSEYETIRSDIGDRRIDLLERYATAYKKGDTTAADQFWMESEAYKGMKLLSGKSMQTWLERKFQHGLG